ncbi:MAG: sigma-54-dependent transcriptional regulator [Gammaproteobacteria bacterium]
MIAEKIMVVDDEEEIRNLICEILEDEGYEVCTAENGNEAHNQMERFRPNLVLLDIWMPDIDGISVLKEWQKKGVPLLPVIMMSGHGNVETAVEATKLGAYDYLEKPLSLTKLLLTIKNALTATNLQKENQRLKHARIVTPEIVGKSKKILNLKEQISRITAHHTPVLLLGESGTDKESVARYIHGNSNRSDQPFVPVNVAALADEDDLGKQFAAAVAGTVFLKDIADLKPTAQVQLYNILQQQASKPAATARVIAASRRNLDNAVKQGVFRDDLYFQLNVVPLHIPALHEHYEDVPDLLEYYAGFLSTSESLPYRHFSTAAQNRLRHYRWPGNIRELRNLVQRLLILGNDETIGLNEIEMILGEQPAKHNPDDISNFHLPLREARENFEKAYLEYQLKQANGSVSKIARVVGMERTHLYRKLKSLGIDIKS